MGIRVQFWRGDPQGIERTLLENLEGFRAWCLELAAPSAGCRIDVYHMIERLVESGGAVLQTPDRREQLVIDSMVDLFVGDYRCWGQGAGLFQSAHESTLSWQHFQQLETVVAAAPPVVVRFWNYLLNGRPVGRDPLERPYRPADPVFRVGFLTSDEVQLVRPALDEWLHRASPSLETLHRGVLQATSEALAFAAQWRSGLITTVA